MSITVRSAIPADLPWLLEQLQAFDKVFGMSPSFFPDRGHAEAFVGGLIDAHPFFIAESDRAAAPVGFIAGALIPHPYNPALRMLQELFWWVDPPYRGSRAGLALLNAYIAYGREHAHQITMSLQEETKIRHKSLMRRGFRRQETIFVKEVVA